MRPADHWCLLAAAPVGRVELARWTAQAHTLIRAELTLLQRLGDPDGVLPAVASLGFTLRPVGDAAEPTVVQVHTLPLAELPAVKAAADRADKGVQAFSSGCWSVQCAPPTCTTFGAHRISTNHASRPARRCTCASTFAIAASELFQRALPALPRGERELLIRRIPGIIRSLVVL